EYSHRGIYSACVFPPDTLTPGFEAENRIKPSETVAVSAGVKPKPADAVAAAIVRGIERDRRLITAEATTAALARGGAPMIAIAERQMASSLRSPTRGSCTAPSFPPRPPLLSRRTGVAPMAFYEHPVNALDGKPADL